MPWIDWLMSCLIGLGLVALTNTWDMDVAGHTDTHDRSAQLT